MRLILVRCCIVATVLPALFLHADPPATQPAQPMPATQPTNEVEAFCLDTIAFGDEFTAILRAVTTPEQAKAAIPAIEKLAVKEANLRIRSERVTKLKLSKDELGSIMAKYSELMVQSMERFAKEEDRIINDASLGGILKPHIEAALGLGEPKQPTPKP